MPDVNTYLNQIESSERGEDVRSGIIGALKEINNGATVHRLNGVPIEEFITKSEFETVTPLLNTVEQYSDKGVKSRAIYARILDVADAVNECVNRSNDNTSFAEAVQTASMSISRIGEEIRNRGVELEANAELSKYADAIREISADEDEYDIGTLSVSENKTYSSSDPEFTNGTDNKVAWNQVDVNVTPTTMTKTITELKSKRVEYDVSAEKPVNDKKVDGYSSVKVNISNQLVSLDLDDSVLPNDPNTLASEGYSASDKVVTDDVNALGFSDVTIDLAGRFAALEVEVNPNEPSEQVFEASKGDGIDIGGDMGIYGYSQVHIVISEEASSFVVEFYNGNKKLKTYNDVKKHQTIIYDGTTPTKEGGWTFDRWEPEAVDVTHDMKCCAIFRKTSEGTGITTDSNGNILNGWDEILQDGGSKVPIGGKKRVLVNSCTFHYEQGDIAIPSYTYTMMKVGAGEDGTTSSWISTVGIPADLFFDDLYYYNNGFLVSTVAEIKELAGKSYGWDTSALFRNLNGVFLASLQNSGRTDLDNQDSLVSHIRPVRKWTGGYSPLFGGSTFTSKMCTIWVPSIREIGGTKTYEKRGIIYKTTDFDPPHPNNCDYRTVSSGIRCVVSGTDKYNTTDKIREKYYDTALNGFQHSGLNPTTLTTFNAEPSSIISCRYSTVGGTLGFGVTWDKIANTAAYAAYSGNVQSRFQFGFCT